MRTYEEVKNALILNERQRIEYQNNRLNEPDASEFDREVATSVINESRSYIDNADEVTIIDIGANVNLLVEAIQRYYGLYINKYYNDFEYFMRSYIMGLAGKPEPRDGYLALAGESECLALGITFEDLKIFQGKSPLDASVVNEFIEHVNRNFNTSVPKVGVYEDAMRKYNDTVGGDELQKAQALISLREVQRNGGYLKNGGSYYIEANDKALSDAKAICSGVTRN